MGFLGVLVFLGNLSRAKIIFQRAEKGFTLRGMTFECK